MTCSLTCKSIVFISKDKIRAFLPLLFNQPLRGSVFSEEVEPISNLFLKEAKVRGIYRLPLKRRRFMKYCELFVNYESNNDTTVLGCIEGLNSTSM